MSRLLVVASLGLLAALAPRARAGEEGWFPFVLPWDDDSSSAVNVRALNPAPAGAGGFIRPRGGHFYDAKGRRVRFLGVNLAFSANFPDRSDAPKVAARMRKFGINVVRLHHMDYFHAPQGTFDPRFKDKQHLDADQLDRLDYFVAQLKRNGVYVNVNLHVSRAFTSADGFKDSGSLPPLGKVVGYFEPRMIRLQKDYARDLLTRRNPYTRRRYADDPAVAVVELTNEDTLLGAAWGGTLEDLPAPYRAELGRQWNDWLKKRYGDTAALKKAWKVDASARGNLLRNTDFTGGTKGWGLERHAGARAEMSVPGEGRAPAGASGRVLRVEVEKPGKQPWHVQLTQAGLDLADGETYTVTFHARADRKRSLSVGTNLDVDDWHNTGLNQRVALGAGWKQFRMVFTAFRVRKGHNRLVFALGQSTGRVELAGASLTPGAAGAVPEGTALEKGTVPLGRPSASPPGRDWVAFLMDVERRYLETLRDYLKKDLGVRANVICSQASYGGLGGALRESHSDFTDMHAYWEHPEFPRRPWDPADWTIRNTAMTRDRRGGTLPHLARYRLRGKPFTVSEYNHPAPNDYQAECVPLLAAFASFQDWDGIYLFDYNADRRGWDSDRVRNFFSVDSNPAKMAFFPAAALLFLRGDLAPAPGEEELRVPAGAVAGLMARRGPDAGAEWEAAGGARDDALSRRLSLSFVPGKEGPPRLVRHGAAGKGGSLRWEGRGTDRALFTADSPRSKVAVGFLAGRAAEVGGWRVEVARGGPRFTALTLTALDGKPAEESRSLLLTAVGRVENAGMGWDARRTSVGRAWGKGPCRAEGIPAAVTVRTRAKSAEVYALDGTGKRKGRVKAELSGGRLTFALGPAHRTLWYEVVAGK